LEPLTAVILGVAVLGEPMTLRMALGMSLIIAAVCLIVGKGGK
jgi:drug/metabolite transporter (DMT)-like permease